jgi:hypothetical protein
MTLQEIQDLVGHRDVPPWVVKLVGDAVAREREACAKLCDDLDKSHWGCEVKASWCSEAIRAR